MSSKQKNYGARGCKRYFKSKNSGVVHEFVASYIYTALLSTHHAPLEKSRNDFVQTFDDLCNHFTPGFERIIWYVSCLLPWLTGTFTECQRSIYVWPRV